MSDRKTMTSAEADGRAFLKPFAQRLAELRRDFELALREASDAELEAIEKARRWYGQTNCWWAEYDLSRSKFVMDELKRENYLREKAKAEVA